MQKEEIGKKWFWSFIGNLGPPNTPNPTGYPHRGKNTPEIGVHGGKRSNLYIKELRPKKHFWVGRETNCRFGTEIPHCYVLMNCWSNLWYRIQIKTSLTCWFCGFVYYSDKAETSCGLQTHLIMCQIPGTLSNEAIFRYIIYNKLFTSPGSPLSLLWFWFSEAPVADALLKPWRQSW